MSCDRMAHHQEDPALTLTLIQDMHDSTKIASIVTPTGTLATHRREKSTVDQKIVKLNM